MPMIFDALPEFQKECKRLSKKFPSLMDDLSNFQKILPAVDFDNNNRFITLERTPQHRIIKTRLMVRSLKGNSKTRVIFCLAINGPTVTFLELYMKSEQEREDQKRIRSFLEANNSSH